MATVSERSREILEKLRGVFKDPTLAADMTLESATAYCDEKYAAIIEQALLAERRLAKLEIAEQLYCRASELHIENPVRWELFQLSAAIRRAAAEKEVTNG